MIRETRSWAERPRGELIDHIVETHHGYLRRELPALTTLMARCAARQGVRWRELLSMHVLLGELVAQLEVHTFQEEQVVFPALRGRKPAVAGRVKALQAEHELAATDLRQLRKLSGDYRPPCEELRGLYTGLEALERDLFHHFTLEDEVLFL